MHRPLQSAPACHLSPSVVSSCPFPSPVVSLLLSFSLSSRLSSPVLFPLLSSLLLSVSLVSSPFKCHLPSCQPPYHHLSPVSSSQVLSSNLSPSDASPPAPNPRPRRALRGISRPRLPSLTHLQPPTSGTSSKALAALQAPCLLVSGRTLLKGQSQASLGGLVLALCSTGSSKTDRIWLQA